jgi:hypothetical protein
LHTCDMNNKYSSRNVTARSLLAWIYFTA